MATSMATTKSNKYEAGVQGSSKKENDHVGMRRRTSRDDMRRRTSGCDKEEDV